MYKTFFKPLFDLIFAFIFLCLMLPVFLILIPLLIIDVKKPFFTQDRPGKNGKIFRLVKFRTMKITRDSSGNILPDIDRLTPFGRFMRKSSLDEIPQFINVLKGDMSIIGPRPLLVKYLSMYTGDQVKRHEVKPGITGWAQVNGRNAITWDQKFQLDLWYVKHLSPWLDFRIMLLTIVRVIQFKQISHPGHATMPEFNGDSKS